ncbi:hypothetical protein GRF29_19g2750613 [Pseudopithomyces chartarum]|uniref:Uncharacterized protein n=1 Tax=Pseudopithomyces chartarum TaxID=1892770 RepID=A0AAN6M2P8_9PLEO|nr:hypothetical protein GRF29_19g2750613 [Pseudopithomyces chartarum]
MAAEYHQSFHGTCQESGNEISETPKCILGDRCFSRDSELDPEKKPKVAVGPEICPLCKNVSIDKLEERTKQDMSGACRAFFAARTLRKNCEKFADDARERRINGEGHIFVCVTKDPEYWKAPWKFNDFDPQSSHVCQSVASPGEMCRPCHERAQKNYPRLKERFRDGGVFIGYPCVWVDPEYEKEDAKIKPGWQNRSTLLEIYNVETMQKESLEGWNIEGQQCHQRMIVEAMICEICRNRIANCSINTYVFDPETFKLNPKWQEAIRHKPTKADPQLKGWIDLAGYLAGEREYPLEVTCDEDLNRTVKKPSTEGNQYEQVNKSKVWGEHKVPMRKEKD